jgi:RimJ/RimL family protein N-acetyltransferase
MGEKSLTKKAAKICLEDMVQKVMDIFEAENGRPFEEKKQEVIEYLKGQEDTLLAERVLEAAINDETGRGWKEKFWQEGNILQTDEHISLRKVCEADREMFIELQKETSMMKSIIKEESYRMMLWNEHTQDKSLMVTIEVDGEYAGYCGINNLSRDQWEIAIELRKKWRCKGIGYVAISTLLSAIKSRLHINEFRVKIDADNYASQRLFEKLGAVPYRIAEYMLHKEKDILRCEEENLDAIDDKLIKVAEKFGVEPRKLLSHILEYKLEW